MLRATLLFIVLCGIPMVLPAANPPRIASTFPTKYMAVGTDQWNGPGRGMTIIRLQGTDLAAADTTGYTAEKDIEVFMHRDSGAWVKAEHPGHAAKAYFASWSPSELHVEFAGADWLETPGYLQFKVVVRGQASDVYHVQIVPQPSGPPVITQLNQASPFHTTSTSDHDWGFRVVGRNFGLVTKVRVNNQEAKTTDLDAPEGIVDATIPATFRNHPGRYSVQVSTSHGYSNIHWVDITAPPRVVSVDPNRIGGGKPAIQTQARALTALPTFTVTVHFTGSDPGEIRVRPAGGNWQAPVAVATKAGAVELKLPSEWRQTPGKVEIRLRNGAGESIGSLDIVDAGKLSGPRKIQILKP